MPDTLVYLYAVTDAEAPEPELDQGVDGAPVRRIVVGRLAAVVSSVDAVRFGEESLKCSLADLHWLGATARTHHRVVDAAAHAGPVAPVRLATVCLDDDRVRGLLADRAAALTAALDRVRGRVEWGVKGFVMASDHQATDAEPDPGTGPGASYLARRLAERQRATHDQEAALAAAEAAHRALAAAALASWRYPPQDPQLSGRREEMVLNAAYLVETEEALRQVVEEHAGEILRLELTGPWAPYSFATMEEP